MPSRTISVERSAYERLRSVKRGGESFTDTINRLLSGNHPSFARLSGILSKRDAAALKKGIRRMRSLETRAERTGYARLRSLGHGRHP